MNPMFPLYHSPTNLTSPYPLRRRSSLIACFIFLPKCSSLCSASFFFFFCHSGVAECCNTAPFLTPAGTIKRADKKKKRFGFTLSSRTSGPNWLRMQSFVFYICLVISKSWPDHFFKKKKSVVFSFLGSKCINQSTGNILAWNSYLCGLFLHTHTT